MSSLRSHSLIAHATSAALSCPQAFFKGAWSNVLRGAGGALVLVFYDEIKKALGGECSTFERNTPAALSKSLTLASSLCRAGPQAAAAPPPTKIRTIMVAGSGRPTSCVLCA
jgi:hypothetical protein